jgi:hypothetical protein
MRTAAPARGARARVDGADGRGEAPACGARSACARRAGGRGRARPRPPSPRPRPPAAHTTFPASPPSHRTRKPPGKMMLKAKPTAAVAQRAGERDLRARGAPGERERASARGPLGPGAWPPTDRPPPAALPAAVRPVAVARPARLSVRARWVQIRAAPGRGPLAGVAPLLAISRGPARAALRLRRPPATHIGGPHAFTPSRAPIGGRGAGPPRGMRARAAGAERAQRGRRRRRAPAPARRAPLPPPAPRPRPPLPLATTTAPRSRSAPRRRSPRAWCRASARCSRTPWSPRPP